MSIDRGQALAPARKLLRTFTSAPDPMRQARSIYSELTHGNGWTRSERDEINALGAWLLGLPPIDELRPRCARILARLA
jgi:hypothetical protein